MKCPTCGQENSIQAHNCRKCNADLTQPPSWWPNWKWHIKTLSCIYLILIAGFFVISFILHRLPPPYDQREISPEMTPWLNHWKNKADKKDDGKTEENTSKAPEIQPANSIAGTVVNGN
ncbi:MAG: hypothetical protein J6Z08_08480 [Elusimicrobiales bacterium]|nr:hypothetical protein [Elusimicrobiales bacterium]